MILGIEIIGNEVKNIEIKYFVFSKEFYKEASYIENKAIMWNEFLKKGKEEYIKIRDKELREYIEERKRKRDLHWYLKRMNAESIRMIVASHGNLKQYNRLIRNYIKER